MDDQAQLYKQVGIKQHDAGLELIEMLSPKAGAKVLDIGSGTGDLTFELARQVSPGGEIFAIEPDDDRRCLAQSTQPEEISNIHWFSGDLDGAASKLKPEYHLAFSNYVFHWIEDQNRAVKQIYDALLPGGRFAFCCVYDQPAVTIELASATTAGKHILQALHLRPKKEWLDSFESVGFRVVLDNEVPDYHFNNIHDVMQWWEATTHGAFKEDELSDAQIEDFEQRYLGELLLFRDCTIRLLAVKD